MSRATFIPVLVTVVLPILWLLAEFKAQKTFRVALGLLSFLFAIVMIFFVSWMTKIAVIQDVSENIYQFVDATINKLEDGEIEKTLALFRDLNKNYKPVSQEQLAYLKDISHKTMLLVSREPLDINLLENTPFEKRTWSGFWSGNETNWFYILPNFSDYDIYRDGLPPLKMTSVKVSGDFKILQFCESDKYRHTLILKNKYEAEYELYHLIKKEIISHATYQKLVPPNSIQTQYTDSKHNE